MTTTGSMSKKAEPCKWCGEPGGFVIQPVMFLGQPILHEGVMCRPCQVRLAGASRFLVTTEEAVNRSSRWWMRRTIH